MAQRRGLFARENKATVQKRSGNRDVKTGNPGDQAFVWSADCSKLVFVYIQIFFFPNYFIFVENGIFFPLEIRVAFGPERSGSQLRQSRATQTEFIPNIIIVYAVFLW